MIANKSSSISFCGRLALDDGLLAGMWSRVFARRQELEPKPTLTLLRRLVSRPDLPDFDLLRVREAPTVLMPWGTTF